MEVQISPCEGAILRGKRYLPGKWLAERAISTILLQRNPSFGEMPDKVQARAVQKRVDRS